MATILVIDDEDSIRHLLKEVLEKARHRVLEARDGREGRDLYQKNKVDLVLMDILMPGTDGLEATLQMTREYLDAKIIAMTGAQGDRNFLDVAKLWQRIPWRRQSTPSGYTSPICRCSILRSRKTARCRWTIHRSTCLSWDTRIPDYSTDAKEGTYSLLLQNNPAFIDSNWVEVDADYELSAPEFCVDMWLNADSSKHATRILNLPEDSGDWNNNNYEISLRNNTKGVGITGRYFDPKAGGLVLTQDTSSIVLGKWYHVIYERNAVNGVVALVVRDENDQLVYKRTATGGPPQMGGVVNHARLRVGRAATDAANYWFITPFRGKLDNIKIYNYPFAGVSAVGDGDGSYLPNIFELGQNYPNPFNPTTGHGQGTRRCRLRWRWELD